MIEQIDMLIALWDGVTPGSVGGTRHTIAAALDHGAPVYWIDASAPERHMLLRGPEALATFGIEEAERAAPDVEALVEEMLDSAGAGKEEEAVRFHTEHWPERSRRRFHAYRRIEAMFGAHGLGSRFSRLVQTYETPRRSPTARPRLLAARDPCPAPTARSSERSRPRSCTARLGRRLSTYLSDAYRGGMAPISCVGARHHAA